MLIANPLYDVVFKRLMENERAARYFIGTLLKEKVVSVEIMPQEFTYVSPDTTLSIFRLDFIATVQTISGFRKILIEIQKARNYIDLMRFRNYLAEQYKKEENIHGETGPLPITTIYILGFTLPEVKVPCIKVARTYQHLTAGRVLMAQSDFIEKLTHDCFIIQASAVGSTIKTPLDEILSIFEQTSPMHTIAITKEYNHQPQTEEMQLIVDILHHAAADPAERKRMEDEAEAWRTFDALSGGMLTREKKANKMLEEKDSTIRQMGSELQQMGSELQQSKQLVAELQRKLEEKPGN